MKFLNLEILNDNLRWKSPEEIISWGLSLSEKVIVTSSFGKYSATLLNALANKTSDIPVIWCDTGYNTEETYRYAIDHINKFKLNIHIYKPLQSRSVLEATYGIPGIDDPNHEQFTEVVKLEPFRRALAEHQPEVWFTNIRKNQTTLRDSKDILSLSKDGILKISPFYYWNDNDLDDYLETNNLLRNDHYFDITKVLENRECGLHLQ